MRPDDLAREADVRARAGDYAGALALREQAYAALRADGDTRGAARLAAYQIAFDHLALFGNAAVSQGWLERGIRLAEESGPCVEAGWVALARALHAADAGERDRWIAAAERAADAFGDDDLYFDALAYRGLTMVEAGRVTDGMRRLDEAAAAAYGGEVGSPVVAGRDLLQAHGRLRDRVGRAARRAVAPGVRSAGAAAGRRLGIGDLPDACGNRVDRRGPLGRGGARVDPVGRAV